MKETHMFTVPSHDSYLVYRFADALCYEYPNGYRAHIIPFGRTYIGAHVEQRYELAVMRRIGTRWHCVYDTPVTSDVERGTETDMLELLEQVRTLEPAG